MLYQNSTVKVGDTLNHFGAGLPQEGLAGAEVSILFLPASQPEQLLLSVSRRRYLCKIFAGKTAKIFSNMTVLGSKVLAVRAVFCFILHPWQLARCLSVCC